jgi:hypothetical protein
VLDTGAVGERDSARHAGGVVGVQFGDGLVFAGEGDVEVTDVAAEILDNPDNVAGAVPGFGQDEVLGLGGKEFRLVAGDRQEVRDEFAGADAVNVQLGKPPQPRALVQKLTSDVYTSNYDDRVDTRAAVRSQSTPV